MTSRRDLTKNIAKAAKAAGVHWGVEREGGNHTIFDLDGKPIAIPRHKEIGENLTTAIYKQTEDKLGKGWWRK